MSDEEDQANAAASNKSKRAPKKATGGQMDAPDERSEGKPAAKKSAKKGADAGKDAAAVKAKTKKASAFLVIFVEVSAVGSFH